jgi:hypothetical protein
MLALGLAFNGESVLVGVACTAGAGVGRVALVAAARPLPMKEGKLKPDDARAKGAAGGNMLPLLVVSTNFDMFPLVEGVAKLKGECVIPEVTAFSGLNGCEVGTPKGDPDLGACANWGVSAVALVVGAKGLVNRVFAAAAVGVVVVVVVVVVVAG